MPNLATSEDLEDLLRQERLASMIDVPEDRRAALYTKMLSAATGRVWEAARRGGFIVPFDFALVAAAVRQNLQDMLSLYVCVLAAWGALPQVTDAPEGLAKSKRDADAFLDSLAKGEADLMGLPRLPAPPGVAGKLAFVGSGESNGIEPDIFTRARRGFGFGFVAGAGSRGGDL